MNKNVVPWRLAQYLSLFSWISTPTNEGTLSLVFLAQMRIRIFFATGITGSSSCMVWRKLLTDGIAGRC